MSRTLPVHFARKPPNLRWALRDYDRTAEPAWVEAKQALTADEYDAFVADFFADQPWLDRRGGRTPSGEARVVEVTAAVHQPGRLCLRPLRRHRRRRPE